mmetsp:Transcript_28889/g.85550  ORF Transcript_28889/g.85550 Transcript_28889/m.85550 type:complete len:391 (+) Transcript_28889:929-2101(+)
MLAPSSGSPHVAATRSYLTTSTRTLTPSPSRCRTCTSGTLACSSASTLCSVQCATYNERSRISTTIGNVGGALRSSTVFFVPRIFAVSSPSVTDSMPPTRSHSVGFCIRFSSTRPCAVPISMMPRSAMVRHAAASASLPISSTMITSGVWFSTASIITWCWRVGSATCMRRALPIAGCGTSPSPPISLEVSTMTTRFFMSPDSRRAISRTTVVLPTPGAPSNSTELLLSTRSRIMSAWPDTARPTRHVSPTMSPRRLRSAEIRCSVPATPARLSWPNAPTAASAAARSAALTGSARRYSPPGLPRKRASGRRPRSSTTSSSSARSGCCDSGDRMSSGSAVNSASRSSCTTTAGLLRSCVKEFTPGAVSPRSATSEEATAVRAASAPSGAT